MSYLSIYLRRSVIINMVESIDTLDANFKSTLPPRKRAKTKEEKEQRRVERILRNRRAAHASREKKRKHVEYLESYVVQLEDNMSVLQSNFDAVWKLLNKHQKSDIAIRSLKDLGDLKEKIHLNLNSSVSSESCEPEIKKRKLSSVSVKIESEDDSIDDESLPLVDSKYKGEESESIVKKEDSDSNELLSVTNDNLYFNYLSPISINSPINSPIDLTLKKSEDDFGPLTLNEPALSLSPSDSNFSTQDYDLMEQNSEEILLHRNYDGNSLLIRC